MARVGYAGGVEADRIRGATKAMGKALGNSKEPVYVMRHGRTALDALKRSDGWLDFPLTDEGRMGIIAAQQYLKDLPKPLACIYAPSLKRTMETAEIIQSGDADPVDIDVVDAARTWNMGKKMLGSKKYPNKPIVKYYMEHPTEIPEEGESLNQFVKRFMGWLRGMMDEKRSGPVLLVTSGSNIREISQWLTGDRVALDLDEGGLMCLKPLGKTWHGTIVLGDKHDIETEPSAYSS
jgi:broad specificity phosphatase PhoE